MFPLPTLTGAMGCFLQGPIHGAMTIVKEEGLLGLWSGASPTVCRNGLNQLCMFWGKNNFDKYAASNVRP